MMGLRALVRTLSLIRSSNRFTVEACSIIDSGVVKTMCRAVEVYDDDDSDDDFEYFRSRHCARLGLILIFEEEETFVLLSVFIPLNIVGAVIFSAKVAQGTRFRRCAQSSCGLFSISINANINFIIVSTDFRLFVA